MEKLWFYSQWYSMMERILQWHFYAFILTLQLPHWMRLKSNHIQVSTFHEFPELFNVHFAAYKSTFISKDINAHLLYFSHSLSEIAVPLRGYGNIWQSFFQVLYPFWSHFKSLGWDSWTGTPSCSSNFVDGITKLVVKCSLWNISFKGVSEFHPWVLANL